MVGHEPAAGKSCEWPELSRISFLSFSPLPFFSSSFSSFLFFRFERREESCSKNKRPCSFFFFFLLSLIFGLRCILSLETSSDYVRLFLKMFDHIIESIWKLRSIRYIARQGKFTNCRPVVVASSNFRQSCSSTCGSLITSHGTSSSWNGISFATFDSSQLDDPPVFNEFTVFSKQLFFLFVKTYKIRKTKKSSPSKD